MTLEFGSAWDRPEPPPRQRRAARETGQPVHPRTLLIVMPVIPSHQPVFAAAASAGFSRLPVLLNTGGQESLTGLCFTEATSAP